MEELYNNMHYKSGWKPLNKEDNSDAESIYLKTETTKKRELDPESAETLTEVVVIPEESEIMKKLFEISENINTLNNMIQSQRAETERLASLFEKSVLSSKKSALGLLWK